MASERYDGRRHYDESDKRHDAAGGRYCLRCMAEDGY